MTLCICPRCGADCTTDDGHIPAECDCGYVRYQEDAEPAYTVQQEDNGEVG